DLLAPPRELRRGHAGVGAFVDDVVDLAAKRIERGDRAAPIRRQEQKAVIEARPAGDRLLLAVFVSVHGFSSCELLGCGGHGQSARASMSGQSNGRSTGRWRKTSPPTRSIFSSILAPPAMI